MTAIIKTQTGRWQVRDAFLEVDEEYETHAGAQKKANECNAEKLRRMTYGNA